MLVDNLTFVVPTTNSAPPGFEVDDHTETHSTVNKYKITELVRQSGLLHYKNLVL